MLSLSKWCSESKGCRRHTKPIFWQRSLVPDSCAIHFPWQNARWFVRRGIPDNCFDKNRFAGLLWWQKQQQAKMEVRFMQSTFTTMRKVWIVCEFESWCKISDFQRAGQSRDMKRGRASIDNWIMCSCAMLSLSIGLQDWRANAKLMGEQRLDRAVLS